MANTKREPSQQYVQGVTLRVDQIEAALGEKGGMEKLRHMFAEKKAEKKPEQIDPVQIQLQKQHQEEQRRLAVQKEQQEIHIHELAVKELKQLVKKEKQRQFEEWWRAQGELIWAAMHGKKPDEEAHVNTKDQATKLMDQQIKLVDNKTENKLAALFAGSEFSSAVKGMSGMKHTDMPAHFGNLPTPATPMMMPKPSHGIASPAA